MSDALFDTGPTAEPTRGGGPVCAYDYLDAERTRLVCLIHRNQIPLLDTRHRFTTFRDLAALGFLRGIAAEEWTALQAGASRA